VVRGEDQAVVLVVAVDGQSTSRNPQGGSSALVAVALEKQTAGAQQITVIFHNGECGTYLYVLDI
jgi:hypothetical protein